MPKSLVSRPLDLFYIFFFIVHLAWSLPFEGQPIYPKWMISDWTRQFVKDYIRDTNDPWMLGVWGLTDTPFEWIWTKVFLWFEMSVTHSQCFVSYIDILRLIFRTFSVPVMFVGMYGLLNGKGGGHDSLYRDLTYSTRHPNLLPATHRLLSRCSPGNYNDNRDDPGRTDEIRFVTISSTSHLCYAG
jgi:hypothetical protein